jgi:sulfatase modifying factor 1
MRLLRDASRCIMYFGVLLIFTLRLAASATAQDRSEPFRDCSECPVMVSIPPGSFFMGVPPSEEESEDVPIQFRGRSVPQHVVTFREGFAIAKYDVTRAEFAVFVRETSYQGDNSCWKTVINEALHRYEKREVRGVSWERPGFAQTERDPVVCVSWEDAKAYINWLSARTRRPYRLPTEAEWEYAARAGSPAARFWGNDRKEACRFANVYGLLKLRFTKLPVPGDNVFDCQDRVLFTAPVGSFEPNPFGLFDMLGNVDQWVEDCRSKTYEGAPNDGSARIAGDCPSHIVRGGAWSFPPWAVRTGFRHWLAFNLHDVDCGFRVAGPLGNLVSVVPSGSVKVQMLAQIHRPR